MAIGVMIGHLLMDSLTVTGMPVYDHNGRYVTLFGGRIRTSTAGEYALSISIGLILVALSYAGGIELQPKKWKALYQEGIIDLREYRGRRFQL
ncbi:MAG: metal-dependent hydrolase [Thermodesulfovibrionales bacterium]